jgi:hypothetical protein
MANPGWPWPLFQVEPALKTFNVDSERRDGEIPRQACDFQRDVPTNLLSGCTPRSQLPRERIPRETLIFSCIVVRVMSSLRRWLVSIPEPELSFSTTATQTPPTASCEPVCPLPASRQSKICAVCSVISAISPSPVFRGPPSCRQRDRRVGAILQSAVVRHCRRPE